MAMAMTRPGPNGGVSEIQTMNTSFTKQGGSARAVRSSATFTVTLGDLPDDLEFPGDGLVSASRRSV
jgi:hypothetical protein